jgi:hypothetical protein
MFIIGNSMNNKMKKTIIFTFMFLLAAITGYAQEDRKVLVEVFTNSHCPLCPPTHKVLDNYLAGPNGDKISYIYYHMVYPYPDDQLYWESQEDSDARDNYYDPIPATPQGWFDGVHQQNASTWEATLNDLVAIDRPIKIVLSGTKNSTNFNINAQLTRTGEITDNDLVLHFVVVEDVYYNGRNSISDHKHVMRKMFPSPSGQSFSINQNETITISQKITVDEIWNSDSLSVIVFVQSTNSKKVYQSETISIDDLVVSVKNISDVITDDFILEQNYPNPFNPITNIRYAVSSKQFVTLKIYDLLGREITTLVNEEKQPGIYEIEFNATELSSGIYFYQLKAGSFSSIKKMVLMQ